MSHERTKRAVVYTAIFGGYDELREPREQAPGVRYVCFTDNPHLRSNVWEFQLREPSADPLLQAKRIKIVAHEAVDCDMSLWIDGRVELCSLNGLFERCSAEVALQKHLYRTCIFDEAAHCIQTNRGDPDRIAQAVTRYRAEGYPRNAGLWQCGIVFRRHSPATAAFNLQWWNELIHGTTRDQISAPVVIKRLRIPFEPLPAGVPRIRLGYHNQEFKRW